MRTLYWYFLRWAIFFVLVRCQMRWWKYLLKTSGSTKALQWGNRPRRRAGGGKLSGEASGELPGSFCEPEAGISARLQRLLHGSTVVASMGWTRSEFTAILTPKEQFYKHMCLFCRASHQAGVCLFTCFICVTSEASWRSGAIWIIAEVMFFLISSSGLTLLSLMMMLPYSKRNSQAFINTC